MGFIIALVIIAVIVAIVGSKKVTRKAEARRADAPPSYIYTRKDSVMTDSEMVFYKRLQSVANGRYLIFPQIHLSSLATNRTIGKYRKLGFQRINRRSVDYILADINTLQPVYAVELDDKTHDTHKGMAIDKIKTDVLRQINLPLVRFRNITALSDQDIIAAFQNAHQASGTN